MNTIEAPTHIATMRCEDGEALAKLLQRAGYKTWLRGRGKRNLEGPGTSWEYQAYLPKHRSERFAVYITGFRK